MKTAFVDTSCFVAIITGEAGSEQIASRIGSFEKIVASNLLEAELRSVANRENVAANVDSRIARIAWLHPDRPLTGEFHDVLAAGYLRGADLWHVAVALWADPRHEITFLTLTTARKRLRVL